MIGARRHGIRAGPMIREMRAVVVRYSRPMSWFSDKRSSTVRMTVVPHRESTWPMLAGWLAAALAIGLLAFWLGRRQAAVDLDHLAALEDQHRTLHAEVEEARNQLVDRELAFDIDRQASIALQETIKELRDDVAELRKEVALYKSLMAPSSLERGLRIADFELTPADRDGAYQYRLLLTQVAQARNWVEGGVKVMVEGSSAENAGQVLSLTELGHDGKYPLPYRFRYFQDLAGIVVLPDGFQPARVSITADPKGRGKLLERTFEWEVAQD